MTANWSLRVFGILAIGLSIFLVKLSIDGFRGLPVSIKGFWVSGDAAKPAGFAYLLLAAAMFGAGALLFMQGNSNKRK